MNNCDESKNSWLRFGCGYDNDRIADDDGGRLVCGCGTNNEKMICFYFMQKSLDQVKEERKEDETNSTSRSTIIVDKKKKK